MIRISIFYMLLLSACTGTKHTKENEYWTEKHRPQIHFTPPAHWMNDPNGLVFYNNTYHLFYQYYPDSTVWGPMHWGHATSTDLVHWQHQPIALYPDTLGYIFSGSAVVDVNNTSGFGQNGKAPMVAIFTHHDMDGEKSGTSSTYQNQSLAYSLDEGKTWTKYAGNPVLRNPGIKDFRDPKVMWHEETKKWVMSLATLDRITFYSSPDLKTWTKESEFGKDLGAHGGVWECPDLFPLEHNGQQVWVLFVSINPGGPNGGSATQYFTGSFDGHKFTPFQTDIRWLDWGPDDYAGVTFFNTGNRRIFIGWMSNWQYGQVVPTEKWRSAMTAPRELHLEQVGDKYFVASTPVKELDKIMLDGSNSTNIDAGKFAVVSDLTGAARLHFNSDQIENFLVTLSNDLAEHVVVGYDKATNQYYFDRTKSGETEFEKGFAARLTAPRITNRNDVDVTLIIDDASVELFADNGLSIMTGIFFPKKRYQNITISSPGKFVIKNLQFNRYKSIYDMRK